MSNSNDGRLISPIKSLRAVQERLTEAVLARHVFNHPPLVSEVRRLLSGSDPNGGALAQQPILEAILPYLSGEQTLDQLSGKLVYAKVIDALSTPAPERQYVFPRSLKPYSHQIESWTLLRTAVPQSVLLTSGTGSGKTECFLIPVLDDLAREVSSAGRLSGVRAIALYPLNALISSQEERLREWTAPFEGGIRFGLYNGLMPEDRRASGQRAEQVEDRKTLRADPPPILVTNVTMLEYMTVRRQDRPLIEASSGKLRWIILDEAHSYVGSRAAEIALLIRRVLLAFKVKPTEVRFVATSATIGEGVDVEAKLKAFLRDVAGVPEDRVHVVIGHRRKPILAAPAPAQKLALTDVRDQGKLAGNPVVQKLMRLFDQGPVRWSEFSEHAQTVGIEGESLIQAFAARPGEGEPLLPIRAHGFVRGVQGIYACLNPTCVRSPEGWPFGAILPEAVQSCPHCGSVVLEIERCDECGEPFLGVVERRGRLGLDLVLSDDDEFAADSENERVAPDEEDDAEPAGVVPDIGRRIAVRDLKGGNILHVDPSTGDVRDRADDATIALLSFGLDACPACDCSSAIFGKFRSGAPFLVGNAAPVLLEGIAARVVGTDPDEPVADEGRQLLSFTDSRQGTARFAALLQNGSERNYVRAAIYHAVQDTLRPPPGAKNEIAAKNAQIAELERLVSTTPVLGEFLDRTKKERDALVNPGIGGLGWTRLREQLSVRPEIDVLMRKVWRFRDERFLKSNLAFTEFLMLRELARRPRRAVALETMGLAGLRYPAIDLVREQRLPRLFREKGLTIESYREFLRVAMSLSVRDRFAIRMDRENVHWFSGQVFQRWLTPPATAAFPAGDGSGQRGMWPSPSGRSGIVRFLEALFGLDRNDKQDRTELRAILEQTWDDLLPLLSQPGAGNYYALDFEKVNVAPVKEAFLCPVTRRLTDVVVAGLSPFGFG